MGCRLVGAKPLPEPITAIYLTGPLGKKWNFNSNLNIFIQENLFKNTVCEIAAIFLGLNVLKQEILKTTIYECIYSFTTVRATYRA